MLETPAKQGSVIGKGAETSEFSRVTSIPRVPMGWGLGSDVGGVCWTGGHGQLCLEKCWWSGGWKVLLEAGDTSGHSIQEHSVTCPLLRPSPRLAVSPEALLTLSWVGWLPHWPGRKVRNKETDYSLTWNPETLRSQHVWGLIGFTLSI